METTVVYWGYIGIMENDMETTVVYRQANLVDLAFTPALPNWHPGP